MELKDSCEKYACDFILKAYDSGGKITSKEIDFKGKDVDKKYIEGINTLLSFYGEFDSYYDSDEKGTLIRTYTLSKEGMDFAQIGRAHV